MAMNSYHCAIQWKMAFGSSLSAMAKPLPLQPCQRPTN